MGRYSLQCERIFGERTLSISSRKVGRYLGILKAEEGWGEIEISTFTEIKHDALRSLLRRLHCMLEWVRKGEKNCGQAYIPFPFPLLPLACRPPPW